MQHKRFRWCLKFHGPEGAADLGSLVVVHGRPNRDEGGPWDPLLFEAPRDWTAAGLGRFATLTLFDRLGRALEAWELETDGVPSGDRLLSVRVLDGQCTMIDRDHPWQPKQPRPRTAQQIIEDAHLASMGEHVRNPLVLRS